MLVLVHILAAIGVWLALAMLLSFLQVTVKMDGHKVDNPFRLAILIPAMGMMVIANGIGAVALGILLMSPVIMAMLVLFLK